MIFCMETEFEFDDKTSPDIISAFHNSSGYNYLLTQLMVKVAQSSINRDIVSYYDGVWELYGWINAHFKEQARRDIEKDFNEARRQINLMNQAVFNKAEWKQRQHYSLAKQKLDELKHFIVRVMSEQNLLSPINRKTNPTN